MFSYSIFYPFPLKIPSILVDLEEYATSIAAPSRRCHGPCHKKDSEKEGGFGLQKEERNQS
jgi:hypothetical protein